MPSPFPGMDPYLEGHLWPDVHQRLAGEISRRLSPVLRPKYAVRLAVATAEEGTLPPGVGVMYPDVEVVRSRQGQALAEARLAAPVAAVTAPAISPAMTLVLDPQDRQVTVEIYDLDGNRLVTSIEILSPFNKRPPGLHKFTEKRERLRNAGVHVLDIDLLRQGERPLPIANPSHPSDTVRAIAGADYLITLMRGESPVLEAWPVRLEDPLPVVPVPLRHPDPDVPLDLGTIIRTVYDEAAYDLTIDYSAPPPLPPLDEESAAWLARQLQDVRSPTTPRTDNP